ncbi:MAG: hypothetical protein NTV94_17950, partial [Planctomycetota bacterium]|nr:hypothetical protein [Planctomycetota bacterium]
MYSMTRAWLGAGALVASAGLAWAQPCTVPGPQVATARNACDAVLISLTSFDRRPNLHYRLWRQLQLGPAAVVAEFDQLPTQWRDTSAPALVDIRYQLEARDGACVTTSSWTRVWRSGATAMPTQISATDLTECNRVVVSWFARECGEAVTVWRAEYPELCAAMPLGVVTRAYQQSFVDSQVELEVPYFYWLTAESSLGESPAAGPLLGRAAEVGPTFAEDPLQSHVLAPGLPAGIRLEVG